MTLLVVWVMLVLVISALCSLSEASLYAVRVAYIRQLAEAGSAAGRRLAHFKKNMEQPITAILILNTAANTAGASLAGAQARTVLGPESLVAFSAVFTLAVLVLSEIIPKVAGVGYNRVVAPAVSGPIRALVVALYPLVRLSTLAARLIRGGTTVPIASEEEVRQFAALSAEEGSILPVEADFVQNVLKLNEITAAEIMTPRSVVTTLPATMTVRDIAGRAGSLPFARIPVIEASGEWRGVALRHEILARAVAGDLDQTMESLSNPLERVSARMHGYQLLSRFLKTNAHLFGVTDETGAVSGVVTLEDVLESLIGAEIVDETDAAVDMREEARRRSGDDPPAT